MPTPTSRPSRRTRRQAAATGLGRQQAAAGNGVAKLARGAGATLRASGHPGHSQEAPVRGDAYRAAERTYWDGGAATPRRPGRS